MKKITKENWITIDPICDAMLVATLEPGSLNAMFPEYWLDSLLEPQLSDDVSDQLKSLFETARGVMVYGYFYYPLFGVGSEQLFRLCEASSSRQTTACRMQQ